MKMYDFALDVERTGRDFYQRMAQEAREPGVQKIFAMMAEEETRLLKQLSALRKQSERHGMHDREMFSEDDNVYRRLSPEQLHAEVHTDLDAYHMIIDLVEEVCQVYEHRAEEMDDPELRGELMEILHRERDELEELLLLYDFTNAPNESLAWGEFSNLGEYPRFGHEPETDREALH